MNTHHWLLASALGAALALLSLAPEPADKIVFLDVGQGDAILIQKGKTQILMDGGEGMVVLRRLAEELPWFDKTIEVVILTHPQRDHIEGLIHVLERYRVNLVLFPRAASESSLAATWLTQLIDKKIPYRFALAGEELKIDDLQLRVLSPFDSDEARQLAQANLNDASTITRLDWRGLSVLLTGDAERPAEFLLLENYGGSPDGLLDVDILKAGHHGSKTSTSQALVAAATPKLAIMSLGHNNRFGHPHQVTLQALQGIPILRTDQAGSIRFEHLKNGWFLRTKNNIDAL